jgi:hypothetical protein
MYPSLLSTSSASRWYSKKTTQQEKLSQIERLEEKIAEQKQADKEVGVRILIRGKPTISSKSSNLNEQEDERDIMEEDVRIIEPEEEDNDNPDTNTDEAYRNMFYPEEEDEDEEHFLDQPSDHDSSYSLLHFSP